MSIYEALTFAVAFATLMVLVTTAGFPGSGARSRLGYLFCLIPGGQDARGGDYSKELVELKKLTKADM